MQNQQQPMQNQQQPMQNQQQPMQNAPAHDFVNNAGNGPGQVQPGMNPPAPNQ